MATTFRSRAKKANPSAAKETLHSRHTEMVKLFKTAKKGIGSKRKALKDLLEEIKGLDDQKPPGEDPETLARLQNLRGDADQLVLDIARVEANTDEDEYYAQNGDLIFQYFTDKGKSS